MGCGNVNYGKHRNRHIHIFDMLFSRCPGTSPAGNYLRRTSIFYQAIICCETVVGRVILAQPNNNKVPFRIAI